MKETSGEERRADRKMSSTVDRETFRKVVSQRQKMKAELRGLQERLAALPEDWEERLPHWLDLERSSLEPASDQIEPDPEPAGGPEMAVEDGEEPKNSEADAEEFNSQAESIPGSFAESREWEEKERGYRRMIADLSLSGMIREAAGGMGAYDPQDVVDLTQGYFEAAYEDGEVKVSPGPSLRGAGPGLHLPENGEEFTLEGVIFRFLEGKPHLVKAGFKPGSGLVSTPRNLLAGASLEGENSARARLTERLRLQNRID